MNATKQDRDLESVGRCSYDSIAAMVAALNCDYERLDDLRSERDDWDTDPSNRETWAETFPDSAAELAQLESDARGDSGPEYACTDQDDARQRIEEDALSVEIRSGWTPAGQEMEAEEYCLLLTTGGPAVRIVGQLSAHKEPLTARLEVQDWGTPWTEYLDGVAQDVLLAYAGVFYYGECA